MNKSIHHISHLDTWLALRQRARTDIFWLCNDVLGYPDVCQEVHGEIVDALHKFKGGEDDCTGVRKCQQGVSLENVKYVPHEELSEIANDVQVLILFPRDHLKSTIATMAHCVAWIINFPNIRILVSSGTGDQVHGFVRGIKNHFERNEKFRFLFPELCPKPNKAGKIEDFGNQDGFSVANRSGLEKERTLSTTTVGSTVASGHYDVLIDDDIVDKENVRTQTEIQRVNEHFGMLWPLLQRYEGQKKGPRYVIGTRYDFSDLYGKILDGEAKLPEAEQQWKKVIRSAASNWPQGPFLWPERYGYEALKKIENDPTQGPSILACTPFQSPVLMADWSEKPIGLVKAGDIVMGFKRADTRRTLMGLVPSKVKAVHKTIGVVFRLTLSSGRTVLCTKDHKWFTGRYPTAKEPHRKTYAPAGIGFELSNIVSPMRELTAEQQRWMDWLGGMLDGEGSCQKRNSIFISQSTGANPEVCSMIVECLRALGYEWTQFDRNPGLYGGRNHQSATQWMLRGGRSVMREILVRARMAKSKRICDSLFSRSQIMCEIDGGKHVVTNIERLHESAVYALETETGNYVVWGFASSNSQYLMNPIPSTAGLVKSEDQIVFLSRKQLNELYAFMTLHCTVDLAGMEPSTNKSGDNDYTVINVHGFGHDGTCYYTDIRHGRFTPFEVIDQLFDVHTKHPRLIDIKIEAEAHSRVLGPFLLREMAKRGHWLPIVPIKRDNRTSKQHRINGLQPMFLTNRLKFADDLPCKTHLILEIMRFPKYAHDDILDTCADAMQNADGTPVSDLMPSEKSLPNRKPYVESEDGTRIWSGAPTEGIDRILYLHDQQYNANTVDDWTGL